MVMTRLMTSEELLALGEEAGRFELVAGEPHEMSPASGLHGAVGMRLGMALSHAVYGHDLGELFNSETGFVIARGPDTVLSPDLAFVRHDRIPETGVWNTFVPFAPDLAVEVESPSNTTGELLQKLGLYLGAGTQIVWLVRPNSRTITVFRPGMVEEVLGIDDTISAADLLPGFSAQLSDIFAPVRGRANG